MNIFLFNIKAFIKKNLTLLGLLFSLFGFSQHSNSEQIYANGKGLTSIDLRSKELVGNSYINETYLSAKLSYSEVNYFVRYNAYLDEMEIEISGKSYYLPKSNNYTVTFEGVNKVYQLSNYDEKGTQKKGFFVVLVDGNKASLLVKEKIKLYDEVPAKLGFTKYEPPTLKRIKNEFYIDFKDEIIIKSPTNKKYFSNLFLTKSKEIELYIKKNKLNIKNESDLIQIFNYYNSIN